jgi:hypothetical protein
MKKRAFLFLSFIVLTLALLCPAQETPARPMKIKVTAEQANLREKPDIGSAIVQEIPEGAVLEADKKEGEWFFVRYTLEDGGVIGGYIHESLVQVVDEGGRVPETKTTEKEVPPRERVSRPIRIGKIKLPDLSTGSFPLEFSFSAGAGSLSPRDLNDATQGYADTNAAALGSPAIGSVDTLHLAMLVGFELSYRVSPRLAIGLGADYLRGANGSSVDYTDPVLSETLTTKPSARAVPVKLSVRYYPGAGFYLRGGLGVYSVKAGYLYRLERADTWQQWKGAASGSGIGAEAAFGGEWEVRPKTVFFVEAGFRMARFQGLTGNSVYTNQAGEIQREAGTLYFFRKEAADAAIYPLLFIRTTIPAEEGVRDARKANINLSGLAFRAGIRYRF